MPHFPKFRQEQGYDFAQELKRVKRELAQQQRERAQAEWRAEQEAFKREKAEMRGQADREKVAFFEALMQNKSLTSSEKIGIYATVQAEEEEKKRQEIGAIDAQEKNVIKSDEKKLKKAKDQGCSHVYVKRICNLSGLNRNTVGTLLKKLSVAEYMVLHHIKMWTQNSTNDNEIHKENYLKVEPMVKKRPKELDLRGIVIKKPKKQAVISVPGYCESCRSPNVDISGRVVCQSCGEVHIYRAKLKKGKLHGVLLSA